MSYADWYEQHKLEWDEETARRKIDRALIGRKTPAEDDVIRNLKPEKKKGRKGKKKR